MEITKDTIIGDVLDAYPDTAPLFLEIGMHCLVQFTVQMQMSLLKSLMRR